MVVIEKRHLKAGRKTLIDMPIRYGYFKPKHKLVTKDQATEDVLAERIKPRLQL